MDRILLSTLVYREPAEIYPTLRAFTNYPRYTKYLESVSRDGDGGEGTRYDLHFGWWKLSYTARSEVREIEAPERLAWRLVKDVDAAGEWRVEPEPESAPDGEATASRIYFEAVYDPHSADPDAVSLPKLVSLDWVIGKVRPRLLEEAERVVRRLVADVEGEPREVELVVHEAPG
ncbi:SRPBCC family protein [Halovivax sp.]|uniref:SRPBCC family protein n=1 Tax=Halovivax sp. TaxID=1935978 RepID=UPI0025C11AD2|nr:SRPBCC family protein [Halovivax sp.]